MTLEELRPGALGRARRAGCAVLDCDGVLVDVRRSYDAAIARTVDLALERFAGLSPNPLPVTPDMIEALKATGGFNDEVDLAYALSLCIAAAAASGGGAEEVAAACARAGSSGVPSVEAALSGSAAAREAARAMRYSGRHAENPVYDIFDQVFYGHEGYARLFGREAELRGPGTARCDERAATEADLEALRRAYGGRVALATGRGRAAAEMGLGPLMRLIDAGHSVFLEDRPRSMAKPSPESLLECAAGMGASSALYVGDSAEDLLMARAASGRGLPVEFCAVTGLSHDPAGRRAAAEAGGAGLAASSLGELANALNQGGAAGGA